MSLDLLIVGAEDGTHLGGSLLRAARKRALHAELVSVARADYSSRWLRRASHRLRDKKPGKFARFNADLQELIRRSRPQVLLATGSAVVSASTLDICRNSETTTVNLSTDDPFNSAHRANWYLGALPNYDLVCTTRRSNIGELGALGCKRVVYTRFGYDPDLFFPEALDGKLPDLIDHARAVVFVGGADADRARFCRDVVKSGVPLVLYGGYWSSYRDLRPLSRGHADPAKLRRVTAAAGVNLCLVRRANRDDHVMRTFEIPACGGFMLAEDTVEHRSIFGKEGHCVLYFETAHDAAVKSRWALAHPDERRRMASAARNLVLRSHNTYEDRLFEILSLIAAVRNEPPQDRHSRPRPVSRV